MAQRTGIVIVTELVKHMCRVLASYRSRINSVVAASVGTGTITTDQANTIYSFLDAAEGACALLRLVTGY